MRNGRDVWVREVGTRDGLQSIDTIFSTEDKVRWIETESLAGVPEIEVGSFVPPKLMPQMADTMEVVRRLGNKDKFKISVLVPNFKGALNAFQSGTHQLNYVLSVSEAHSLANVKKSVNDAIEDYRKIIKFKKENAICESVKVGVGVATAFGCTIQGEVKPADVFRTIETLVAIGADEIAVADTVGYGNPAQIRHIFKEAVSICGDIPVAAHFHDTRGLGLANVDAALDVGVRHFDSSLGGLGGCPHAPGASGNIVTDDLVFMLEAMGLRTGVDLEKLLAVRVFMESCLKGEPTRGAIARAGTPKNFLQK